MAKQKSASQNVEDKKIAQHLDNALARGDFGGLGCSARAIQADTQVSAEAKLLANQALKKIQIDPVVIGVGIAVVVFTAVVSFFAIY